MATVCVTEFLRRQLLDPKGIQSIGPVLRRLQELGRGQWAPEQFRKLKGVQDSWECRTSDADRLLLLRGSLDGQGDSWIAESLQKHDDAAQHAHSAGTWREWSEVRRGRIHPVPESVLCDIGTFEAWLRQRTRRLPVLLSPEQTDVVRREAVVRLEGVPGSGKTLTLVHRLCGHTWTDAWAGYFTASRLLVQDAEEVARGLERQKEAGPILFADMSLLVLALAKDRPQPDGDDLRSQLESVSQTIGERPDQWSRFSHWYKNRPDSERTLPPRAAWTEIRSVLLGREASIRHGRQRLLPLEKYLELGQRKSAVPPELRENFHALAQRWVAHLESERLSDEMDLVASACTNVENWSPEEIRLRLAWVFDYRNAQMDPNRPHAAPSFLMEKPCSELVVDEVQDLTRLEVDLVRRLADRLSEGQRRRVLFLGAGDVNQCIHPTGFDWAEAFGQVRSAELSRNFRSGRSLGGFAHAIMARLKRSALQPFAKQGQIQWSPPPKIEGLHEEGPSPARWTAPKSELLEKLGQLPATSDVVILARGQDCVKLRERLGADRVSRLEDFKGLERDTVIVYRFFGENPQFWEQLRADGKPDLVTTLNEVNRLFVAATRALRNLVFFDEPDDPAPWEAVGMAEMFQRDPQWDAILAELQAGAQDWEAVAREYEAIEAYEAVAAAYRRAGNEARARRCEALQLEKDGKLDEALGLFQALGCKEDAARIEGIQRGQGYVRPQAGNLEEAIDRWRAIGEWERSAQLLLRLGRVEDALREYRVISAERVFAVVSDRAAERAKELLRALEGL